MTGITQYQQLSLLKLSMVNKKYDNYIKNNQIEHRKIHLVQILGVFLYLQGKRISMIKYRKSTEYDKVNIQKLIEERFGNRESYGVLDNIENRYLLAYDDDRLIAMTGLNNSGYYNGLEVDLTCILKEYEGRGIITHMLTELLKGCTRDVYCSCWRVTDNEKVNLYHSMQSLGFEIAIRGRINFNSKYNNCSNICKNSKPS